MEHKLATLLRQAADDADARFTTGGNFQSRIAFVLANPDMKWRLAEKPDPYIKLKKAYTEGKTIQFKEATMLGWKDCEYPAWSKTTEYRIKPQTETRWLWANKNGGISEIMMTEANYGYDIKLEWSKTDFEVAG
jgi:hypothetical protein